MLRGGPPEGLSPGDRGPVAQWPGDRPPAPYKKCLPPPPGRSFGARNFQKKERGAGKVKRRSPAGFLACWSAKEGQKFPGKRKRLPVMDASSVHPFPWTDRMIDQALTCMLEVVRGSRDDPLDKENIRQAVIICRSTSTRSSHSSLLQEVTVGQLTQLLTDMRQRYVRICELADNPRTICFSPRYCRIVITPDDAAHHIFVRFSSYF